MAVARTHPADTHHLPAALQQAHAKPAPIPFPDRPANARTSEPSESTRKRWERMGTAITAAREAGHTDGERTGFRQGWRWGLAQGLAIGAVLTSIGWAVWLTATAPNAAPPSATRLVVPTT